MLLADYLRPLLRAHDCVIIPGFGGLVAAYASARVQPGGRHVLSPPRRQLAFNQSLTRDDGLLLDALRQRLGCSAAEAAEQLRQAVAALHQELGAQQLSELPGIGVFRQLAGRGLQFEPRSADNLTDNLLAAAYGLPELTVHPVRTLDARVQRQQQAELVPRLRAAGQSLAPGRRRRVMAGAGVGLLAGLLVAALYLAGQHPGALPAAWRARLPGFVQTSAAPRPLPAQQAALVQPSFAGAPETPAPTPPARALPPAVPHLTERPVEKAILKPGLPSPPKSAGPGSAQVPTSALKTKSASKPAATSSPKLPLARPSGLLHAPVPFGPGGLALRRKKMPLPLQATVNTADESNVARPIPLAQRRAARAAAPAASLAAVSVSGSGSASASVPVSAPASTPTMPLAVARPTPVSLPSAAQGAAPRLVVVASRLAVPAPRPVAPVVPSRRVAGAVVGGAALNKARTGRFYVVVAAFISPLGAQRQRNALAGGRFPAKILPPPAGSRLYRVSAADYASLAEATAAAARLRRQPGFDQGLSVYRY